MAIHHHPLISFQAVSKTFGDDPLDYKALVLKNVHLDIYPGEFVIIFGASGSGKSTLLNLMAGLEFPTAGKILVRSRNITRMGSNQLAQYHRLKMGMVFQSFNLIKSLKVWENVALPQAANGIRYSLRRRRALHLLKLFNIERYADRRPSEISGGEQQRVAISRALINNPAFLLVDEPTGNLDSESAQDVMNIFKGLHEHGKHTVVLVTHNPDYLSYASRVVYMQDGMVVKQQTNPPQPLPAEDMPLKVEHLEQLGQYKEETPLPAATEDTPAPTHQAMAEATIVPPAATQAAEPGPATVAVKVGPVTEPEPDLPKYTSGPHPEHVLSEPEPEEEQRDSEKESDSTPTQVTATGEKPVAHTPHSWPLKVPPILPKAAAKTEDKL